MYLPGCLLESHLNNIRDNSAIYEFRTNEGNGWITTLNAKIIDSINSDDWDFITFQQGSPKSGIADSYNCLEEIIATVRSLKPNAKFAWHMTWAYQQDYTSLAFENNYSNDQNIMYNAIINSVKSKITNNINISFIIPNGTTIQNARTSFLGDTLTRDGFHMSYEIGRYITALTYAYYITGYSLDEVTYKTDSMSYDVKNVCVESVKNAIEEPFNITKSIYKSISLND